MDLSRYQIYIYIYTCLVSLVKNDGSLESVAARTAIHYDSYPLGY